MFKAIGVIELKNIPKGVEATDAALKSAGVEMVASHPSCPGKYEIILTGSISNVTAAVEHVLGKFDGYVIDSSIMGRIDEQVITALFGTQTGEKKGALGLIETFSESSGYCSENGACSNLRFARFPRYGRQGRRYAYRRNRGRNSGGRSRCKLCKEQCAAFVLFHHCSTARRALGTALIDR